MPRLRNEPSPGWSVGVDRQSMGTPHRIHFRRQVTVQQRRHLKDALLVTWPWSSRDRPQTDRDAMDLFERRVFEVSKDDVLLVMVYDDADGRHWNWHAARAQALLDILEAEEVTFPEDLHVFCAPSNWSARDAFIAILEQVDEVDAP